MPERIDCRKPEPSYAESGLITCRWCGRVCYFTPDGKLRHASGYKRRHPDPRKKEPK